MLIEALRQGMKLEVWTWQDSRLTLYQELANQYPSLVKLRELDEYRVQLLYTMPGCALAGRWGGICGGGSGGGGGGGGGVLEEGEEEGVEEEEEEEVEGEEEEEEVVVALVDSLSMIRIILIFRWPQRYLHRPLEKQGWWVASLRPRTEV